MTQPKIKDASEPDDKVLKKAKNAEIFKRNLPKKQGNVIQGGPGRPKGVKNKFTRQAKENIAEVFDKIGGVSGMVDWARANPSEFYSRVYPRLLPMVVNGRVDVVHKETQASKALERLITGLIAEREESRGDRAIPVTIDSGRDGRDSPFLGITSETGTDSTGRE